MQVWQELMDEAYEWWQTNRDNISYKEFLKHCRENMSEAHFVAVVLGNLNYQVCNGGFRQWVDNGYATDTMKEVREVLKQIGTENSIKIDKMLNSFQDDVEMHRINKGFCGDYWKEYHYTCDLCGGNGVVPACENEDEDEVCPECYGEGEIYENPGSEIAKENDDKFYLIMDEWQQEVEDFLINDLCARSFAV